MGTSTEEKMTLAKRIGEVIPELGYYGIPEDLVDYLDGLEFVYKQYEGSTRWGALFLSVFRLGDELVGIMREEVAGDGESGAPDEWGVFPVAPVQITAYEIVK